MSIRRSALRKASAARVVRRDDDRLRPVGLPATSLNHETEGQTPMSIKSSTVYLVRPGGRIGYDISGEGPLVILVPGMGDLRTGYRFLAPALREAGYRVACTDLRGHGASDATFASYGDVETAGDVVALIEELKEPAVVIGNSMGAGAAAFAAAQRPDLVRGLVLVGPFVRNPKVGAFQRIVLRVAMARPWVALTWKAYLPKLYAGRRPAITTGAILRFLGTVNHPDVIGSQTPVLSTPDFNRVAPLASRS